MSTHFKQVDVHPARAGDLADHLDPAGPAQVRLNPCCWTDVHELRGCSCWYLFLACISASQLAYSVPGPIEVSDEVLGALALPSQSHVAAEFVPIFGDCLRMTREVVMSTKGQPFLISGSGTLGACSRISAIAGPDPLQDGTRRVPTPVAANLIQPGENALVLHSGYFGDSFTDCLETYGAKVDQVKAEIGAAVSQDALEAALKAKNYRLVTMTHVDTSTGVLTDAKAVAETVQRVSPDTLVILDGVCSVASEELRMDAWGIDVVLTASQKGLGVPPGLSIVVASPAAIKVFESRTAPIGSYYASWKKWLPIMKAYESGKPAYFATPPVNLIYAYHESLTQITKKNPTLQERIALHRAASAQVKDMAAALGLKQVALDPASAANGMTALYYPEGLKAADVVPKFAEQGVVVAGGLHAEIKGMFTLVYSGSPANRGNKDRYFRIGHMGVTVVDAQRGDMQRVTDALKAVFASSK
ncbi:Aminotran-5 domain-containing protein [Mycena chlorophos]|uniref:alanine--glyoxylate transaminase n=1 Tax=Mycena chlorophos TaxID=658473 RepID=A0A8H6WBI2_MYCCL|nr:Aminotran-5 domain-containing protein [Mycena chlorophos]